MIFSGSLFAKADSLDAVADTDSSTIVKTFDELTSVEQDFFYQRDLMKMIRTSLL